MKRKRRIDFADFLTVLSISDFFILSVFTFLLNWVYEEWTLWIVMISSCIGISIFATVIFMKIVGYIAEKIHFHKLDKYYKEHPEEDKKRKEEMAKHFEELADCIRKG